MMVGRHRENGIWLASTWRWRVRLRGHDSIYVAVGRVRLRLMKPRWLAR